MATTSIDYKHPYASLQWLHLPSGGSWQDASLLSGYVGGQGTKTLEVSSATQEETGSLKCVVTNSAGASVDSSLATITGAAQGPALEFTTHPKDETITATP
jgi:hypothetical protein